MSASLRALLDSLEETLEELLDDEQEQVEAERDFLLAVLDGTTEGVSVEDASTELTAVYLEGFLSNFLPIEED